MVTIASFEDAVAAAGTSSKSVLLGNGFSIALKPDIFAYQSLRDRAEVGSVSASVWQLFDSLGTNDFETVMKALRTSAIVARAYDRDEAEIKRLLDDADSLRDLLVQTIANSHPERPGDVADHEYASCQRFLSHFARIYTLNYDLLLYWTLMNEEEGLLPRDDGFRLPEDDYDSLYVTWDPSVVGHQKVYYLHGALHLFDAGPDLKKYTWSRTGIALIDQIREAMAEGAFPHFVSEATSLEKRTRIRHSAYLSRGERSLYSIGSSLFTYGFSFSENDAHILRAIRKSKVNFLGVGLYGDPSSESNEEIISRVHSLAEAMRLRENRVVFFSSESAAVWDGAPL